MRSTKANKKSRFSTFWKNKTRRMALVLMIMGLMVACKQKTFDSEKELWAYVKNPEHGYQHQKILGEVQYTLTYRPNSFKLFGFDFS